MTDQEQKSDLIHYLRLASNGVEEAIKEQPQAVTYLVEVDALMYALVNRLAEMKAVNATILLMNCHAAYRAALSLVLSGQVIPTYGALRASIESALYANAIVQDSALFDVWLKRHSSPEAQKSCRMAFTIANMMTALTKAHDQEFTDRVREAYDSTIDFGAHPNSRMLISSTTFDDHPEGHYALNFTYLHGTHSGEACRAIVACFEAGITIFFIMLICFEANPDLQQQLSVSGTALQDRTPELVALLGFSQPAEAADSEK